MVKKEEIKKQFERWAKDKTVIKMEEDNPFVQLGDVEQETGRVKSLAVCGGLWVELFLTHSIPVTDKWQYERVESTG